MVKKLLLLILLGACGSTGVDERASLRSAFSQGNFASARAVFEGEDALYKDEKDRLLLLMEKGNIAHAEEKYEESAQIFKEALELEEKLFTVSVSGKVKKALLTDQSDVYYGETYEIAAIHLLQTLNHLKLFEQTQSRDDLFRARAQVMMWNKYLENRAREAEVAPVYKDDLMARIFGAYVHELVGTRTDQQVALDLYVKAHEVLIKNYAAYPSFNSKSKTFVKDYKKFPKLGLQKVLNDYVAGTEKHNQLKNFLEEKVLAMAKSIRPSRLDNYLKLFGRKKSDIKTTDSNVHIVLSKGMGPMKVAKPQYIGLTAALEDPEASKGAKFLAGIGAVALTIFAANTLGLLPPPNHYSPVGARLGIEMSYAVATGASVKFELPSVNSPPIDSELKLEVQTLEGKTVETKPIYLVQPIGDIANQAVEETAVARYWRVGVRLALKHAAAIAASFATYKAIGGKKGGNDFLAKNAAVFQYLAAAKGIEASERADTRGFTTLPESFNVTELKLAPGKYRFQVIETRSDQFSRTYSIGEWEISAASKIYYARI